MDYNPSSRLESSSSRQTSAIIEANSYRCSFCRRGFSTAQALGGHMNIHRRDRAKLMMMKFSSSSENLDGATTAIMSTESTHDCRHHNHQDMISSTIISTADAPADDRGRHSSKLIFVDDQSRTNDDDTVKDNDSIATRRSLPLFTGAALPPGNSGADEEEAAEVELLRLIGGDDDQMLDLELRLGPHQPNNFSKSMPPI